MSKRLPSIIAYVGLFALSLPVPLLHHYRTDKLIETTRPVINLSDGQWAPMLMPVHILLVRWLSQLSWVIPCSLVALLALSLVWESFSRPTTVCAVAICQCAFTTFYACYVTLVLGGQWLEWTPQRPNRSVERTAPVRHVCCFPRSPPRSSRASPTLSLTFWRSATSHIFRENRDSSISAISLGLR